MIFDSGLQLVWPEALNTDILLNLKFTMQQPFIIIIIIIIIIP